MLARVYLWARNHVRRMLRSGAAAAGPGKAIVTLKRESSSRLFFVFQGKKLQLMMDPLAFFRETGLINANLIMVGDEQGFFYHAGLNRDLPDLEAIRVHLQACMAEMPHVKSSCCLGSSAGGYAAILFGHYLKVDTVYAFAPQTLLDLNRLEKATGRKDTWRFPTEHLDLSLLLATHNGRTRYQVFFCADFAEDRAFAERIAGCPGVELYPQPGKSHVVVREMRKRGALRNLLQGAEARLPSTPHDGTTLPSSRSG